MNDVFLKDRAARDCADFEGCGKGSTRVLSEGEIRKQKLEEVKFPLLILMFMIGTFLLTLKLHSEELLFCWKATAVTIPYTPGDSTVRFDAPNGNRYVIDVSKAGCKKDQITLYYRGEDYQGAEVMTVWWLFPVCYLVSLGVGGVLVRNIYKTLHSTRYATQNKGSGKFED